ncbi:hypothetical protein BOTBODRAFT_179411 [Botryobasidium botryosum FD-172 SS1]|uniref:Uncharacterized protein n=1 Tax=Botryobasidium botryosum (strain FD-172 SS1) TaxID=930990 RepID=A0A067LZP3_BOTB1|nr:hypothetical protein BOTBODRAFT_179411 [Botryobasidium botryosum FD-172 SS1]
MASRPLGNAARARMSAQAPVAHMDMDHMFPYDGHSRLDNDENDWSTYSLLPPSPQHHMHVAPQHSSKFALTTSPATQNNTFSGVDQSRATPNMPSGLTPDVAPQSTRGALAHQLHRLPAQPPYYQTSRSTSSAARCSHSIQSLTSFDDDASVQSSDEELSQFDGDDAYSISSRQTSIGPQGGDGGDGDDDDGSSDDGEGEYDTNMDSRLDDEHEWFTVDPPYASLGLTPYEVMLHREIRATMGLQPLITTTPALPDARRGALSLPASSAVGSQQSFMGVFSVSASTAPSQAQAGPGPRPDICAPPLTTDTIDDKTDREDSHIVMEPQTLEASHFGAYGHANACVSRLNAGWWPSY